MLIVIRHHVDGGIHWKFAPHPALPSEETAPLRDFWVTSKGRCGGKTWLTKQMLMQSLSPAQLLRCPPITTVLDALALYRKDAVAGEIRVKPKPTRGILAV